MERAYSAVFKKQEDRVSSTSKNAIYKNKLAIQLKQKESLISIVRQREAQGTVKDSLQLFTSFCVTGFAKGYIFKLMFSLVFRIVRHPTQLPPLSYFISQELFRFGSSVGLVVGLYRGILSYLRQKRYQSLQQGSNQNQELVLKQLETTQEAEEADRYNRAVAGFFGGFGLLINDSSYRQFASKYAFVRALDLLRNRAERLEWIPKIEKLSYYLFGLINGPIMYSTLADPSLLTPWYYDFILWAGALSKEGAESTLHRYVGTGLIQPKNPCEGFLYSVGGSRWYIALDWFYGLYRCATLYGPVHLVPMLLFRTQELMTNPLELITYLIKNIWLSSCFLSTYQTIVKISAMPFMEISQAFGYNGMVFPTKFWLCGFLTAFSCEFERPSRVNELMIYCATHSMDIVWNWLVRKNLVRSVQYGEVLFFCVACAVTFSSELQDIKSTYRSMLQYLVKEGESLEVIQEAEASDDVNKKIDLV